LDYIIQNKIQIFTDQSARLPYILCMGPEGAIRLMAKTPTLSHGHP
jgi:hypothetical protein